MIYLDTLSRTVLDALDTAQIGTPVASRLRVVAGTAGLRPKSITSEAAVTSAPAEDGKINWRSTAPFE